MMNRSVLDRQMFRYGGSVPMQDGGIASLPQEMPMEAPMEPSPEMIEEMEMQQLQGAAMEQGVEPDVLEDTLAQHAESFARMDEAEDYETVINEIRGDELPISARYEELAGMVGQEDAQATPESVLTLVQPVIQLASIDQGIGGLAAEEMMDVPVEGPMAEGIMSTIDMQGAEQEAVPPVNFNQGGAVPPVQYFREGGAGAIPKIDFRTVPGMQSYSRAAAVSGSGAGQMGTYDFRNSPPASIHSKKEADQKSALEFRKKVAAPSKLGTPDIPSQRTSAPSGNALKEPRTTDISPVSYEDLLDPEAEQAAMDRLKKLNKSQLLFAMSKGFGNIASGRGSLATRLSQGLDHVFGTMGSQAAGLKALKDSQAAARAQLKAAQTKRKAELEDAIALENVRIKARHRLEIDKLKERKKIEEEKPDYKLYHDPLTNNPIRLNPKDPKHLAIIDERALVESKTGLSLDDRLHAINKFANKYVNFMKNKDKSKEEKDEFHNKRKVLIEGIELAFRAESDQTGQNFYGSLMDDYNKATAAAKMFDIANTYKEPPKEEEAIIANTYKEPPKEKEATKATKATKRPKDVEVFAESIGNSNLYNALGFYGGAKKTVSDTVQVISDIAGKQAPSWMQDETPTKAQNFLKNFQAELRGLIESGTYNIIGVEGDRGSRALKSVQDKIDEQVNLMNLSSGKNVYLKIKDLAGLLQKQKANLSKFYYMNRNANLNKGGKQRLDRLNLNLDNALYKADFLIDRLARDYYQSKGTDIETGQSKPNVDKEVENKVNSLMEGAFSQMGF